MLLEDTPSNYIKQLFIQVFNVATTEQLNKNKISIINFNSKRKKVDKKRVDINGHTLSNKEFKMQAIDFFHKAYPNKKEYEIFVNDAIDDYLIIEDSYFNY